MGYLQMAHSLVRWVIVLAALAAIIRFVIGMVQKSSYDGAARGLQAAFSGLMDLQVLLGIILMVWRGLAGEGFPLYRIEHALVMVAAAVVGHLPTMWKSKPDPIRYRNGLLAVLGSIVLVVVGVLVLPQGWFG